VKSLKSLAIGSAFLLTGGIALAAPPQKTATPPQTKEYQQQNMNNNGGTRANSNARVHETKGTVKSVSDTNLTVRHRYMGKERTTKFKITTGTKREGMVNKGSQVEVFYRTNQNGKPVATLVRAQNQKG
jgi:hypothetical protein